MTTPRLLRPAREGFRFWYAAVAGIGWWMVHLSTIAALARLRCSHPDVTWVMHGITVVLALLTAQATWWSLALLRENIDADETGRDAPAREYFLGLFGLLIGAVSVLLIVWEGAYVPFLRACGA